MTTIKEWLDGKSCTSIMFYGSYPGYHYDEKARPADDKWFGIIRDRVLTMDEAAPWLSVSFDTGFGSQECPDFWAWSPTHIYCVHEYDGSVSLRECPRNPPTAGGAS